MTALSMEATANALTPTVRLSSESARGRVAWRCQAQSASLRPCWVWHNTGSTCASLRTAALHRSGALKVWPSIVRMATRHGAALPRDGSRPLVRVHECAPDAVNDASDLHRCCGLHGRSVASRCFRTHA